MAKQVKKLEVKDFYNQTDLDLINYSQKLNIPVLIVGETGTGKTTLIKQIAEDNKKELIRVSINGQTGTEEILGKYILDDKKNMVWVDGILTDAVRNGKWIVFDEINAASPEILFALHQLLDDEKALVLPEKNNEKIKAHKDFKFFASMNPEDYSGTKILNQAFMSRFNVIEIKPLEKSAELKLLKFKHNITAKAISDLYKVVVEFRKLKDNEQISYFLSTRDLEMTIQLLKEGMSWEKAFKYSIWSKIPIDDKEEIKDISQSRKTLSELLKHFIDNSDLDIEKIEEAEQRLKQIKTELTTAENNLKQAKDDFAKVEKEVTDKLTELNKKEKELANIEKNIQKKIDEGVLKELQKLANSKTNNKEDA